MLSKDLQKIIDLVRKESNLSSSEVHLKLKTKVEQLTTKRNLTKLVNRNLTISQSIHTSNRNELILDPHRRKEHSPIY